MKEKHKSRVFFMHLSIRNCLDCKMSELQVCTETLISSHSQCIFLHFPSLLNTFLAHIGSVPEEKGLENYLKVLSAIMLLPRLVDNLLEMILPQGVASCLFA